MEIKLNPAILNEIPCGEHFSCVLNQHIKYQLEFIENEVL